MPAHRSRTEHWRDCLQQIHERGGALELSVDRSNGQGKLVDQQGSDVVWRCKLLAIKEQMLLVEPPAAFGANIMLDPDVRLIGGMTIGQNRWMFHTRTLGSAKPLPGGGPDRPLVLQMPDHVERCPRRSHYRISTADLQLPSVQCWPLLDPSTVGAAEAANRASLNDALQGRAGAAIGEDTGSILLPEVGPMFRAKLLNISGGGLGLLLTMSESSALGSKPFIWMRLDLRPGLPAPVAVTTRLAHTHIDSGQNLYAGVAFDFSHNPGHRSFVAEMMAQYVRALQSKQKVDQARAA